jgi:hypothetical protein
MEASRLDVRARVVESHIRGSHAVSRMKAAILSPSIAMSCAASPAENGRVTVGVDAQRFHGARMGFY